MRYFWRFGQGYLIKKKLFYTVSDPFLVWLVSDRSGNSGNKLKNAVVKKCWQACVIPAIRKLFENVCLQSLALTKVSFNDFRLRYDSMGCSWNISFRYGWIWIRFNFPISIFLKFGKAGWYCVTKGNIFFFVLLLLFSSDLFLSLKLTSKRCFSKNSFGYPLFFRRVLKLCMFLLNVESFFTPGGWYQ